jgi:hypothetical protein
VLTSGAAVLSKHFYKYREGIEQHLPPFLSHRTSISKQDSLMNHNQALGAVQGTTSDSLTPADRGPSLQRAAILFVASVSLFVGASLLFASL